MKEMPWQELKKHLMIFFPGYGWSCWIEPGEAVYDKWHENYVRRGHDKDIALMIGIEDDRAVEITCGGGQNMRSIEWCKRSGTMPKSLTERRNGLGEPKLSAIEEEK